MEAIKQQVENWHVKVRGISFKLWKATQGQPRGAYLVKCATLEEFNQRTDFLTPTFYSVEKIKAEFPAIAHPQVLDYFEKYDTESGFMYIIAIYDLGDGYMPRFVLSPQYVYKNADRD